MATPEDVRRIALGLPETTEGPDFGFVVDGKAFVWLWRERIEPKRARVPNPDSSRSGSPTSRRRRR